MILIKFPALSLFAKLITASLMLFMAFLSPVQADSIRDILSPGDLIKGHIKFNNECDKCHKKFDKKAQSGLCQDCHKDIGKDINDKRGLHGHLKEVKECKECHTDHKGRDANIIDFDTKKFDHSETEFLLKGKHLEEKVKCKDCHQSGKKYREAPKTCNGCHKKDDKHKGGLGSDCAKCHVEKDWKTTNFDHSKTKYPLLGKHVEVKCVSCHIANKYKDTPKICNSCHKKDDKHKGAFGAKCETCHIEKSWKEIQFDHDKKTKYRLLFKHREIKCVACHKGDLYKDKLKMTCDSCHTKDDKHKGAFGPKCETCHIEKGWKEILFDHNKKTKYTLQFKHSEIKCVACHKGDLYKDKLKMTCDSCHTKDDKHKGAFGPKCETCHIEKGWKEILFDHDKKTKYTLLFKHREIKCVACHKGDLYKDKLKMTCDSCHTKDDKHKGKFGPKCETCHLEKGWKETLFNHDKMTKYPLLFKHRGAKCDGCHKGDLYKDKLQTTCILCHEKDDKHKGQEGKKCETCHTEESWNKAKFDHRQSRFPLTGKHSSVECKKCHLAPTFKDAKSDCWSCHEKHDVHKRRLGTACETCHNTRDWKVWDFDHDKTNFKLEGKHTNVKCYDCHKDPVDKKIDISTTCVSCHSKDDEHNGDFGRLCERCHVDTSWKTIKAGGRLLQ
jgi:hypothetical protein